MTPSLFALLLSGFLAQQAAPVLELRTDHTRMSVQQPVSVSVQNTSEVPAFDVEVTITHSPGLVIDGLPHAAGEGWTCVNLAQSATCTIEEFPGGGFDLISFALDTTSNDGGHHSATATLSARDLGQVGSITFDVIALHPYVVRTAQDFVPGSLRDAIEQVNANPVCGTDVPCSISFAIPGPEPQTYAPIAPLPPIRKCNVTIAGPEDLEFPLFKKLVAISGENVAFGNGLEVRASCAAGVPGVTISSLAVHSWPWNGIYFEAPEPHTDVANFLGHFVRRVYVGTDASGLVKKPNRSRGIVMDSPHEILGISDSIASGNGRSGIAFFRGIRGGVISTRMGVDREGKPMGNGAGGFFSSGVPFSVTECIIAYNNFSGIAITPGTPVATILFNRIHTNGNVPIDWAIDNRSRDDDDESDGILNAPRMLDAVYDAGANLTRIHGVVRLTAGAFGGRFAVQMFVAATRRGDVIDAVPQTAQTVFAPATGTADVMFDLVIPGDYRGKMIALQTLAVHPETGPTFPHVSSEISEALPVR